MALLKEHVTTLVVEIPKKHAKRLLEWREEAWPTGNKRFRVSQLLRAATPALLAHASFGEKDPFVSGKHFYEGREIPWTY